MIQRLRCILAISHQSLSSNDSAVARALIVQGCRVVYTGHGFYARRNQIREARERNASKTEAVYQAINSRVGIKSLEQSNAVRSNVANFEYVVPRYLSLDSK